MTESGRKSKVRARVAWFNCQAGVAGDMTLAALIDAGAQPDDVVRMIAGLGVGGYAVTFERVQRCGVGATWANVVTHDHHDGHTTTITTTTTTITTAQHDGHEAHRPVREIYELLDGADLPDRVAARARAVFERLATVEGAIHGIDPADVELHEVGALDSIIDVVGVCAALESLGIAEIRCSPIALGSGTVRSAHGLIPNPAPATLALLRDAGAADRRAGDHTRGDHTDRSGSHDHLGAGLRGGTADDDRGRRLRRRHCRHARARQRGAGRDRHFDRQRRRIDRLRGGPARGQPRRRDRARSSPRRCRRCSPQAPTTHGSRRS